MWQRRLVRAQWLVVAVFVVFGFWQLAGHRDGLAVLVWCVAAVQAGFLVWMEIAWRRGLS